MPFIQYQFRKKYYYECHCMAKTPQIMEIPYNNTPMGNRFRIGPQYPLLVVQGDLIHGAVHQIRPHKILPCVILGVT